MSKQISFKIEDAEELLTQLQQLNEIIQQDWSKVLNHWNNLEQTWHDESYNDFRANFNKLAAIYNDEQTKLEEYIVNIKENIEVESKLKQLGTLNK